MVRSVYVVSPVGALAETLGQSVGTALRSMMENAEHRRRRQEFEQYVDGLREKITEAQDKETATYVLKRFEACNFSPDFDFISAIQAFQQKRMYDFAINEIGETFADALIARMRKFASMEYETTINEVLERTLVEVGFGGNKMEEAERLLESLAIYTEVKEQSRKDSAANAKLVGEHEIGGRKVLEFSDGRFELETISGAIKVFETLSEVRRYIS